MNKSFRKILMMLAASDFRESDLITFANTVQRIGPEELLRHVYRARKLLSDWPLDDDDLQHAQVKSPRGGSKTRERIEQLLIEEAGLPKMMAVELLARELQRRHPNESLPSESRKGFALWLEKLERVATESELLHIATQIRNKYVHETRSDWRLK